ncbi:MAG: GAF domain-containing protein, partial [Deltaproteobacteria bacterium]|nr:GAF domain-containing protein [Deltaproteobacteria bacterium]
KAAEQIGARFNIPIIYLTAYADEETLERAKQTEPFGYILKPFEDRELHTAIQMGLYKHNMERKLRESEQWLATTLSSIGDGVIASDGKGRITFVNPVAEAMTGWKCEEALHQDLTKVFNIVNGETRAPAENPVMKVLREGIVVDLTDHILITKGGTEKPIEDSGAPIRDEKGNITGAVLVFKDITQRRQAEQERAHLLADTQHHLKRITALREITLAITSTLDLRAVLDVLLEKIDLLLPYPIATIRLLNRETGQLEPAACRNLNEEGWKIHIEKNQGGLSRAVFEDGTPMVITNLQADPRVRDHEFLDREGVVSYLGVPLIARGEILGVLAFCTREEHHFSDGEVEFLTTLAGQAAIAVNNSWLHEQVQRRTHELAALYDVTAMVNQSLEMEPVLQEVIKKITEIFHFDATRIYLFNTQMDELHLRASFENVPDSFKPPTVVPRGQGINGRVAETGKPMIFEDAQSDPRYKELSHGKSIEKAGFSFFAVFPIKVKEKSVGTLACIGRKPRSLTTDKVQLITSMAGEIGVSVENTRLFEEVKRKSLEQGALREFLSNLLLLDLDSLLERLTQQAVSLFKAEIAWVRLFDKQGKLWSRAIAGDEAAISLMPLRSVGKLVGRGKWMLDNRKPLAIKDMAKDPVRPYPRNFKAADLHGFLGAPLFSRDGKPLGVIFVITRAPREFSQREIELIEQFANGAAIAIENARLYEETERQGEIQKLLKELSQDITSLDIDRLLKKLTEKVRGFFKVDVSDVRILLEGEAWRVVGISGIEAEYFHADTRRPLRGRSRWIVQNRKPLRIPDIAEKTELEGGESLRKADIRGYLGIPLFAKGGEVVGILRALTYQPREFTQEEVDLLQQLANGAAIALENARLFQETEQRAQEQAVLNTIAMATSQSLDLNELLQISLDKVLEITGRERGYIRLKDPVTGEITLAAHRGISEEYVEALLHHRTPGGKSDQVFESGEPLVVNDPEGTRLKEEARQEGFCSIAWVPLKAKGNVIGIMNVSTSQPSRFEPREVEL